MTDAPPPVAETPPPSEPKPVFEIQVGDGRGLLLLRPRAFFGWLIVEHFELQIPGASFPLDITRGMAQFQKHQCVLNDATLAIDDRAMQAFLARRAPVLASAGFEEVQVRLADGVAHVSARARIGSATADLRTRAHVEVDGLQLRLVLAGAYTFGYVRRPAPLLAHDLACVLFNAAPALPPSGEGRGGDAVDSEAPVIRGLGDFVMRPLELFLTRVLPPAGWRLPDTSGVSAVSCDLLPSRLQIRYANGAEAMGSDTFRNATHLAESIVAKSGDERLMRSDFAGAVVAYRDELQRRPDAGRFLTARLLSILCARDGTLRDTEMVARSALEKWPDLLAAPLALAAVAVARGRDAEAAEQFRAAQTLAETLGDAGVAVGAALAAARLYRQVEPGRAAELYERVLKHHPNDGEACDALAELYTETERWPQLKRLLAGRVAASLDAREQASFHVKLGDVLFGKIGDTAGARAELEQAVRLDANERRAWDLLARVEAACGDRTAAMASLDKLAVLEADGADPIAQARTQVRIAALCEELGDDLEAERRYRRALALDSVNGDVMEKVAALAAKKGALPEAILGYEKLLALRTAMPERRRRAERELLRLFVASSDLDGARRCLASTHGEPDPEAMVALAGLEETAGDIEAALDLLARAAARSLPARTSELELKRAQIQRELGRGDERLASLTRAAESAPSSPSAEEAARELLVLARAAGDPQAEGRWLDLLVAVQPKVSDWPTLTLTRAQQLYDRDDAPKARALVEGLIADSGGTSARKLYADVLGALGEHARRADVLENLADEDEPVGDRVLQLLAAVGSRLAADDGAGARSAGLRARELAPDDPMVQAALGDVAWHARAWEEIVTLYESLLPGAAGGERVEFARRLGVAFERLGRTAEALSAYRAAVDTSDGEGEPVAASWRRLAELKERLGEYLEAAEAFRSAAADERTGEPPAARADLYRRAADLHHRRARAHAEAIVLLEAGLQLAPDHLDSLDALEAIYVELGDDEAVARTLERKLVVPGHPERQQEWLVRLAELAQTLGRPERARDAYRTAYERDAHFRPAVRHLAQLALKSGEAAEAERLYTRLAVDGQGDPSLLEERRQARVTLAHLYRDTGRFEDAQDQLWAAVDLSPPDLQHVLLLELEELHERAANWPDLVVVLTHHATLVQDATQRQLLEARRIAVLLEKLNDPRSALDACLSALGRAPRDPRLTRLYVESARAVNDSSELAEALTRLARVTSTPAERAAYLLEAAELHRTRLLDPDRAEELRSEVLLLPLGPEDGLLLARSVPDLKLSMKLAMRAAPRLDSREARADAMRLAAEKAVLLGDTDTEATQLEALWRDHLARPIEVERLAAAWRAQGRVAEVAPLYAEALRARADKRVAAGEALASPELSLLAELRQLAEETQQYLPLAEGLSTAAAATGDRRTAAGWLRETAALRQTHLADPSGAADALTRALWLTPEDGPLLTELEPLLLAEQQYQRLAEAMEQHLATLPGTARLPLLRELARLNAEVLHDDARAQTYLDEAHALDAPPPPPAPEPMPEAAPEASYEPTYEASYEAPYESAPENEGPPPPPTPPPAPPASGTEHRVNLSALLRMVAPDVAQAAARAKPTDAEIRNLEAQLAQLPASKIDQVLKVRLRLAERLRGARDYEGARRQLELVLSARPAHAIALSALVEVELGEQRWREAADALDRLSHLVTAPDARAQLLYRRGELLLRHAGDPEAASAAYLQAIDLDPRHVPTLRRLVDYFWTVDDRDSVVELATLLDEEGGLLDAQTATETRARAALAVTLAGQQALGARLAQSLGEGGVSPLARALTEGTRLPSLLPKPLVEATRKICQPPGPPLDAVKAALVELGQKEPRARALANQL